VGECQGVARDQGEEVRGLRFFLVDVSYLCDWALFIWCDRDWRAIFFWVHISLSISLPIGFCNEAIDTLHATCTYSVLGR
jgi:hypothetical protein